VEELKTLAQLVLSFVILSSLVSFLFCSTATAQAASILSEVEYNDTFETANPILLNRTYTGTIEYYSTLSDLGSSSDYYKFVLPTDGNIIVTIKNQVDKNWYLDILTSDTIFNTATSNYSSDAVEASNKRNKIETGLPAGTYYIKITGSAETVDVPYYFETTFLQSTNFEKEPNDTLEEATPIKLNTVYSGVVEDYYVSWPSSGSSDDYYVFTLDHKTEITAAIKFKKDSIWYLELTNSTGDRLIKLYSGKPNHSTPSITKPLEAGTYYVRMSGFQETIDQPYRFILSNAGSAGLGALNEVSVYIDGEQQSFSQPPVLRNGTTFVPMRAIFKQLGATVRWNSLDKVVTATKDGIDVILTIDSKEAIVNGKTVLLAEPATIMKGSTMVPLRFVSQALGSEVVWDADSTTVYIRSNLYYEN
jgi:hypothetical protein